MLDPWLRRYRRESGTGRAVVVSAIAHALLVCVAAQATRRDPAFAGPPLYNRVYYLPPPNARPQRDYHPEQLEWVTLSMPGPVAGGGPTGRASVIGGGPTAADATGDRGRDYATTHRAPYLPGTDSVYTEIEVDSVATRFLWSAAPRYPERLLAREVEGMVRVQYVVDTTGFADTASFRVLVATDTGFATAVRSALPRMRFAPAKIGTLLVRQLVEQDFTFRIRRETASSDLARKSS